MSDKDNIYEMALIIEMPPVHLKCRYRLSSMKRHLEVKYIVNKTFEVEEKPNQTNCSTENFECYIFKLTVRKFLKIVTINRNNIKLNGATN